jgi:hypothetical protein
MTRSKQVWHGRRLTISAVNPSELTRRIHEAVALRAFQIYKSRGCVPGQELEDWRHAEREVVKLLSCGFLGLDDKISVDTDASIFQEGEIEICVEPRRMTVCGKERVPKGESTPRVGETASRDEFVFYVLDLPIDIDPLQVGATFNGCCLEIDLPYARGSQTVHAPEKAA